MTKIVLDDFGRDTDCYTEGLAGKCGLDCPIFKNGYCENASEVEPSEIVNYFGREDAIDILELYPEYKDFLEVFDTGENTINKENIIDILDLGRGLIR